MLFIHPPVLAVQALVAQSGFERVVDVMADVATIVIALALIAAGLAIIAIALATRKLVKRVHADLSPVRKHLEAAAANVEYVSLAVRQDVEKVSETVRTTSEKVQRATEAAGTRLGELNALMDVVQAEAEDVFIRTAAAVRGVQAGAGSFAGLRPRAMDEEMDDDERVPPRRRRRSILD